MFLWLYRENTTILFEIKISTHKFTYNYIYLPLYLQVFLSINEV